MSTNQDSTNERDPLAMVLVIIVAFSLLAAAVFLSLFYGDTTADVEPTVPPIVTPGDPINPESGEDVDPEFPEVALVTADDIRELALALAAVITAVSGLFGLVATQFWRGREESRLGQSHMLELERERLELERERLKLEQERYELQRERDQLSGNPPAAS